MTAPLSVSRPTSSGNSSPAFVPPFPAHRVVSVSPRDADVASHSSLLNRPLQSTFMTPRDGLDEAAIEDLMQTLRALVNDSLDAARSLAAQIARAEEAQVSTRKTAQDLHERLRLGARMLSAFQSQIVRIEESLVEQDRRDHLRAQPSAKFAAGAD